EQLEPWDQLVDREHPGAEHCNRIHRLIRTMNQSTMSRSLNDPWSLGGVSIPNRVVLAPLAGIGNWFVRLQAKRHGAGLAVSEMVSSFAIHYRNERTCNELLRIHPDERAGGPVSIQ